MAIEKANWGIVDIVEVFSETIEKTSRHLDSSDFDARFADGVLRHYHDACKTKKVDPNNPDTLCLLVMDMFTFAQLMTAMSFPDEVLKNLEIHANECVQRAIQEENPALALVRSHPDSHENDRSVDSSAWVTALRSLGKLGRERIELFRISPIIYRPDPDANSVVHNEPARKTPARRQEVVHRPSEQLNCQ